MQPLVCIQCQLKHDIIPSDDIDIFSAQLISTGKAKAAELLALFYLLRLNMPIRLKATGVHEPQMNVHVCRYTCTERERLIRLVL